LEELSTIEKILVAADEFFRKIVFHLRSMTLLELERVPAYFIERLKNLWHTLTRRAWPARITREFVRPILSRRPPDMHLVGRRCRPKPYNGRVVLFRRSLRAVSKYLDWNLGWADVIPGELDVVEIQGGHGDMLDGPQVERTAVKLAAYLRDPQQQERQGELRREVQVSSLVKNAPAEASSE